MFGATNVSFSVPRPLSEWEMDDVRMAIDNIINQQSFFYAGSDDVADEIVRFVADHQVLTNLEEVVED